MQLLRFLDSVGRNYQVVATKADRLSGNQLTNALASLREALGTSEILPFSAKTGDGRNQLWDAIRQAAAAAPQPRPADL